VTENYWTASDGVRLFYRYDDYTDPWTDAPLLVLVHPGLGSSARLFGWVPHLARRYRVVRPDVRGHGKSEPGLDQPLTQERLARDLVELMDQFGVPTAHVMGTAAGGMVTMQAALRWPERFRSLALYAAAPGIRPDRPKKGNWLARVRKDGVRRFLTETARERVGNVTPAHLEWYLDTAEGVTPEFLARFMPLMASEYYPEKLAAFDFPVLMVVPDPDPMVERAEYDLMRRYLRNCTFVTIPGAAHSMSAEIPDRCAEELHRFLDALPGVAQ
jgi:pimeloyl-ACP methyl ester carboxylesterase